MTFDEKEQMLVELFNRKKSKEEDKKEVNIRIKELRVQKARVLFDLDVLRESRRQAYLSLVGKGKYAEIIMEPVRLRNELSNLKGLATDSYSRVADKKAIKEYEGKAPVYMEDIEIAEAAAVQAEQEVSDIITKHIALVAERKGFDKSIKAQIRLLNEINKELRQIEKSIKKTDRIKTEEVHLGRTK